MPEETSRSVNKAVLLPPYAHHPLLSCPAGPPGRPVAPTLATLAPNPFPPAGGATARTAAGPTAFQ